MFRLSYVFMFFFLTSLLFLSKSFLYVYFVVCLCSFNFTQTFKQHKNHFTVNLLTVSCGKLFALNQTWLVLSLYNIIRSVQHIYCPAFFSCVCVCAFLLVGENLKNILYRLVINQEHIYQSLSTQIFQALDLHKSRGISNNKQTAVCCMLLLLF